jgi:hypothetical protein
VAGVDLFSEVLAERFRGDADDDGIVRLWHTEAGHGLDHLMIDRVVAV